MPISVSALIWRKIETPSIDQDDVNHPKKNNPDLRKATSKYWGRAFTMHLVDDGAVQCFLFYYKSMDFYPMHSVIAFPLMEAND